MCPARRVTIPTYLQTAISKTVRVKIASATFFKEYSTSFLMMCRLIGSALVVFKLLMFKVCVIIGISKIKFFNFSGTERVTYNCIFRHECLCKQPILTKQCNYNIFFVYNITGISYIVISYTLICFWMCFLSSLMLLFFPVIISEFHEKPRRKN